MTNPPKEKDTPKEAANELEEKVLSILLQYNAEKKHLFNQAAGHGTPTEQATKDILSLINKQRQEAYNEGYSNGGFDAYNQVITYAYQDRAARLIEPDNLALACKNMRGRLKELESKEEAK